jgi:histidine triad (HIT) family protein
VDRRFIVVFFSTALLRYTKAMSAESIFSKIISGEIPSYKVYEDNRTLAFLDIYAVVPGHTQVIPKTQVEFAWDLEDEDYHALMATVKKVARRLRDVTGSTFIAEKVIGVDVPHAHVHLIPFDDVADVHRANQESGEPDHQALNALAQKLYFE